MDIIWKRNKAETVALDDISTFKVDGNAVVAVLKNQDEIRFNVMKDAFDIHLFYQMIDRIKVTMEEEPHFVYTSPNGYVSCGEHHLMLNDLKKECGDTDPTDYYKAMFEKRLVV